MDPLEYSSLERSGVAWKRWVIVLGILNLLLIAAVIPLAVLYAESEDDDDSSSKPSPSNGTFRKNVIFVVPDGFGPTSETMARLFYQEVMNNGPESNMPLDKLLVGSSRTRSDTSLVTDSAAGATAFSCNHKTYNAAIGVFTNGTACGTVLEAAKLQRGMLVGAIATSRITHATPASFTSHVVSRESEDTIAYQMVIDSSIGVHADLLMGGGLNKFSNTTRGDKRDVIGEAMENGYKVMLSVDELRAATPTAESLPLLGLFAPDHLEFELDRDNNKEPSLAEMTEFAIKALHDGVTSSSKYDEYGFFLLVESSRVDMAAHNNDAACHVREILQLQDTVDIITKYVDNNPGTVMIVVADHETGGVTIGTQLGADYPPYEFFPEVLEPVTMSLEVINETVSAAGWSDIPNLRTYLNETIVQGKMGIFDLTTAELDAIVAGMSQITPTNNFAFMDGFRDLVRSRANVEFTTHGHTGVDVNLYAYGEPAPSMLKGQRDNTEVGKFMTQYLGLNLEAITELLNKPTEYAPLVY